MLLGNELSVKGFPRLRPCGNRTLSECSEICKTHGTKGELMFYFLNKFRFFYCFTNKQIHTWKQLQYHLVMCDDTSAEVCLPVLYAEFCLYFEALLWNIQLFSHTKLSPWVCLGDSCFLCRPHVYIDLSEARLMWAEAQMQPSLLQISTEDSPLLLPCQAPRTEHLLSGSVLRVSITQARNANTSFSPQSPWHFFPVLPSCSIMSYNFPSF